MFCLFLSCRRRYMRLQGYWSSDVCSSVLFVVDRTNGKLIRAKKFGRVTWGEIGRASCRERVYFQVASISQTKHKIDHKRMPSSEKNGRVRCRYRSQQM